MTTYYPDNWIIIEASKGDDNVRKILSGWKGGYLDGDSWRLSSGITDIIDKDTHYEIHNESGSIYICNKQSQRMNMCTSGIYSQLIESNKDTTITTISL